MYEDFLAEKQSIETDIDTMIIIKAKKDTIAEVETMLAKNSILKILPEDDFLPQFTEYLLRRTH